VEEKKEVQIPAQLDTGCSDDTVLAAQEYADRLGKEIDWPEEPVTQPSGKEEAASVPAVSSGPALIPRLNRGGMGKGAGFRSRGGKRKGKNNRQVEIRKVFNMIGDPISFQLPVPTQNKVFKIVTTFWIQPWFSSSASVEIDTGKNFTLSLMNSGEFSGLQAVFDQVKIAKIEAIVSPQQVVMGNSTSNQGILATCVDYDSSSNTSLANLVTYQNSTVCSGLAARYHAWTPTCEVGVGAVGGSTVTDVSIVYAPWLDIQTGSSVPHYGLKAAITATDAVYKFDLLVRYHLLCRQKI
jgi:hypothetical protein